MLAADPVGIAGHHGVEQVLIGQACLAELSVVFEVDGPERVIAQRAIGPAPVGGHVVPGQPPAPDQPLTDASDIELSLHVRRRA